LINFFKFDAEDTDSLLVMEEAVSLLREKCVAISINEETGEIKIIVETTDKQLSADIANTYWKNLEKYNIENRMTKGKQKRIFIEKRLEEVKSRLDSAATIINRFQKQYKTLILDEQTKNVISIYSDLISQEIEIEIEIGFSKQFVSENSQQLEILKKKKQVLKDKIKLLEKSEGDFGGDYLLNLKKIPDIYKRYEALVLNINIQKKIYKYLMSEYEQAKIEEAKDLPTIEIIDKAIPAGKRSKPQRAKICILSFFLALILSSLFVYIRYKLKESGRDQKLHEIIKNLRFF